MDDGRFNAFVCGLNFSSVFFVDNSWLAIGSLVFAALNGFCAIRRPWLKARA